MMECTHVLVLILNQVLLGLTLPTSLCKCKVREKIQVDLDIYSQLVKMLAYIAENVLSLNSRGGMLHTFKIL